MDIDHFTAQPDLVAPAIQDPLSLSLHQLSHSLRRMRFHVVADGSLFWPKDGCGKDWPCLESLVVMFHMVSASGRYYLEGPRGAGRDMSGYEITSASYPPLGTCIYDEVLIGLDLEFYGEEYSLNDQRRIVPNNAVLRPFLAAFAKATARMTSLKEAALWCPLIWRPNIEHDSDYWSDPNYYPYHGD